MTCGIHFVWTTYGTWLPGDDRGHWSPMFDLYGRIVELGGKLNMPSLVTNRRARESLKEQPKFLDSEETAAVVREISSHVTGTGPEAWAAALEPNHVHLLVSPLKEDVKLFAGRIKGRTCSVVCGLPKNAGRSRVWTSGYWRVFLFDFDGVFAVRDYIEAHNLRRGLPAQPFPWIKPIPGI